MNIHTIAENLRNTIAGKEKYLSQVDSALAEGLASSQLRIALSTTQEFLEINIDELKRILKDVERCNTSSCISYDSIPMNELFLED